MRKGAHGADEKSQMVGAAGLEPATLCLEGRCSIRLSYAPTLVRLIILPATAFVVASPVGSAARDGLDAAGYERQNCWHKSLEAQIMGPRPLTCLLLFLSISGACLTAQNVPDNVRPATDGIRSSRISSYMKQTGLSYVQTVDQLYSKAGQGPDDRAAQELTRSLEDMEKNIAGTIDSSTRSDVDRKYLDLLKELRLSASAALNDPLWRSRKCATINDKSPKECLVQPMDPREVAYETCASNARVVARSGYYSDAVRDACEQLRREADRYSKSLDEKRNTCRAMQDAKRQADCMKDAIAAWPVLQGDFEKGALVTWELIKQIPDYGGGNQLQYDRAVRPAQSALAQLKPKVDSPGDQTLVDLFAADLDLRELVWKVANSNSNNLREELERDANARLRCTADIIAVLDPGRIQAMQRQWMANQKPCLEGYREVKGATAHTGDVFAERP